MDQEIVDETQEVKATPAPRQRYKSTKGADDKRRQTCLKNLAIARQKRIEMLQAGKKAINKKKSSSFVVLDSDSDSDDSVTSSDISEDETPAKKPAKKSAKSEDSEIESLRKQVKKLMKSKSSGGSHKTIVKVVNPETKQSGSGEEKQIRKSTVQF